MVGQQRQQISELQFDRFSNPQSFLVWKIRFTNQVTACSDFPPDAILWFKVVGMVDYFEKSSPRDQFVERIFPISRYWTRRLLLLWTRSSRIPSSRRRSVSRSRKPRKRIGFYWEDRSRSWSTTTFEWLALMIQYQIMLIYSLSFFMMTIFRNSIQDGTKFYVLSMSQIPSEDILESLYKVRIRESAQLQTVLEMYDMEIHQKISDPNCH